MDKSNLELFKQAINEAVSNKFDNMATSCTEEIVCSEKHNLAMRAIVYGKTDTKRVWSPRMKRIIAILVAAALLLTSCGIIFRNEIREMFKELFASITFVPCPAVFSITAHTFSVSARTLLTSEAINCKHSAVLTSFK